MVYYAWYISTGNALYFISDCYNHQDQTEYEYQTFSYVSVKGNYSSQISDIKLQLND